jgi:hypothetical protein
MTVLGAALVALLPGAARAGEADVTAVKVSCTWKSLCRFDVTVKHADEGWKHYADRWEILSPSGAVIATRILRHPHVDKQPFTRGLPEVRVPEGVTRVTVRAHDSVHGYGGKEFQAEIPREASP